MSLLWAAIASHIASSLVAAVLVLAAVVIPPVRRWISAPGALVLPHWVWAAIVFFVGFLTVRYAYRKLDLFLTSSSSPPITWRDYNSDIIDGIRWTWRWGWLNPETADNHSIWTLAGILLPLCPQCSSNLEVSYHDISCPNMDRGGTMSLFFFPGAGEVRNAEDPRQYSVGAGDGI